MTHRRSFVAGVVLGGFLAGCGNASRAAAPPPPPAVEAEAVVEQDVPIAAEWVGTLVASPIGGSLQDSL
jgi:multidrug efflux pump subunit AcrA (membrane-fusion protein)